MPEKSVTVTANWTYNGGTGTASSALGEDQGQDVSLTPGAFTPGGITPGGILIGSLKAPVKKGYNFTGWYTKAKGNRNLKGRHHQKHRSLRALEEEVAGLEKKTNSKETTSSRRSFL